MNRFYTGMRVRIVGITDEDADLNGRTGVVMPKVRYPHTAPAKTFGDIGVKLDEPVGSVDRVNVLFKELRRL